MTLGELATEVLYSLTNSEHITAESTYQIKSNAYSFGCSFAEVEVDIPLCKVKLLNMINVHGLRPAHQPGAGRGAGARRRHEHGLIGYGMSEQLLVRRKDRPARSTTTCWITSSPPRWTIRTSRAQFVENYEPTSAYGTKALGEPPACPGAPAIRNAVLQATGVAVNAIPLTPHLLFRRFREEGLI